MAWPLRGGRGAVKAWPLQKNLFEARKKHSEKNVAIKLEGKVAWPLKKITLLRLPLGCSHVPGAGPHHPLQQETLHCAQHYCRQALYIRGTIE